MKNIEETLLKEAIKPSSNFISALISPKVEKVRQWAYEKGIEGEIDKNRFPKIIELYLTKLSHRVSEITSIAFDQAKLSIGEAYEPLKLEYCQPYKSTSKTVNLVSACIKNNGTYIITDSAGMGKSTFAKYLVGQILLRSEKIPILYDLRKVNKDSNIVKSLVKEFDFPGTTFSRGVFYRLLKLGKFVVILDGFDEVPLERQEAIAQEINDLSIKGEENSLIITSRPQDLLPDLLHGKSLRFETFTSQQAHSLVLRYDAIFSLNIGNELIQEFHHVPEKFIETPLLVSLLYRTYGINKSIANRVCTFYDEVYNALYKGHDLINKNGFSREKKSLLDLEDFKRLLRVLCYYMSLNRKTAFSSWDEAIEYIDKASIMCHISPSTSSNYLSDLLVAVPLMFKEGGEYKFLHKTILEFFTAEYLVYYKDSYNLVGKIYNSNISESFNEVFRFLYDINPQLFNIISTKPYAESVLKRSIGKNIHTDVLETYIFNSKRGIGLFSDKRKLSESIENFSEEIYSYYCLSVKFRNKSYLLTAFDLRSNYKNIFKQTWLDITEYMDLNVSGLNLDGDVQEIKNVLGINKFNTLSYSLIDEFNDNEFLTSFIAKQLKYSRQNNCNLLEVCVLSKEKAKNIIDSFEVERNMEVELNAILEEI